MTLLPDIDSIFQSCTCTCSNLYHGGAALEFDIGVPTLMRTFTFLRFIFICDHIACFSCSLRLFSIFLCAAMFILISSYLQKAWSHVCAPKALRVERIFGR